MFRKMRKVFAFTLALVMMFSMTAYASERNTDLKVDLENTKYSVDGPVTRGPAPAVSSVNIEGVFLDNNGNVIVQVYVVGYGNNEIAKYDGQKVPMIKEDLISGIDRVVYAFRQYYNCGTPVVGSHPFTYQTTSINYPRNTVYASTTVNITQN